MNKEQATKTYDVSWKRGRKVGAIGVFYPGGVTVAAETPEEALLKAYKTHEHLMFITVSETELENDSGYSIDGGTNSLVPKIWRNINNDDNKKGK